MRKNYYRTIAIATYLIISLLTTIAVISYVLYKEKQMLHDEYTKTSKNLLNKTASLIDQKRNATMALTLVLSQSSNIIDIFEDENFNKDGLKKLSMTLKRETDFKNVWFQAISSKGASLYRSWNDKKLDDLTKVRQDLRDNLQTPSIQSSISIGKYDLSFKAMVPVFKEEKFLGIVESITHFNSIAKTLKMEEKVEPMVIVEKQYSSKLQYPFSKLFIDDYYIANLNVNKFLVDCVKNDIKISKLLSIENYLIQKEFLVTNYPIYYKNKKLASFLVFKELKELDLSAISRYKYNSFMFLILFIIVLGLILFTISYYLYSKELKVQNNHLHKNRRLLEGENLSLRRNISDEREKNDEKNRIMLHQSKMATMGEMIGNIAHQWRQPLSVIMTSASGIKLKKQLDMLDEKEHFDFLDSILNSAQYLSNTINDFRYFFSPNKQKKRFNTKELIDKLSKLIEKDFMLKGIELIKEVEEVELIGYESELLQVIINLVNNSRDELIKKEEDEKYIFIKIKRLETAIFLEVKDNAGGIPKSIKDKIFEPYFTTKIKTQGTGIGLYMSNEIISKHMKGKLFVDNEKYEFRALKCKGACFKMEIPLE